MLPLLYLWQWSSLCGMYVCILSIYIAHGPWCRLGGMYACIYVCMHLSIYLSIYIHTPHTHTCTHACTHAHTRAHAHTRTHILSPKLVYLSPLSPLSSLSLSLTLSPFPLSLSPSLSISLSLSLSGCNGQSAERREGGLQTNSCRNCRWVQGPEIGILSFWSMICAHVLRP